MAEKDYIVRLEDLKLANDTHDAEKYLETGVRQLIPADWEGGNVVRSGEANGNNGTLTFENGWVRNIIGIRTPGGKVKMTWSSNFAELYIICYDKTLPARKNSRQLAFIDYVTGSGTNGAEAVFTLPAGTAYVRLSVKLTSTEETVADTVAAFDMRVPSGVKENTDAVLADALAEEAFRELDFERGGLQVGTGKPTTNAYFVRTINPIYGGVTIKVPDGFRIRRAWYFDAADGTYVSDGDVGAQSFAIPAKVTVDNTEHTVWAKFTIANAVSPTTTVVQMNELRKASMASYYHAVDSARIDAAEGVADGLLGSLPIRQEALWLHTCVDKTKTKLGSGDKFVAIGDSITVNYSGAGVTKNWCQYVAALTGATLLRKAKGSAGYVCEADGKKMMDMVDAVTADTEHGGWTDVKVAFLAAGTNDRKDEITISQIRTAVQAVIDEIHTQNADTHIVFITPIRRRHSAMDRMAEVAAAIAYTGLINGCSVINGFDFPIPMEDVEDARDENKIVEDLSDNGSGTHDGLHPGIVGMQIYARSVIGAIM